MVFHFHFLFHRLGKYWEKLLFSHSISSAWPMPFGVDPVSPSMCFLVIFCCRWASGVISQFEDVAPALGGRPFTFLMLVMTTGGRVCVTMYPNICSVRCKGPTAV